MPTIPNLATPHLGIYLKEMRNYIHINHEYSWIYLETTQISTNRWTDKQVVTYLLKEILLSHKKELGYCHM